MPEDWNEKWPASKRAERKRRSGVRPSSRTSSVADALKPARLRYGANVFVEDVRVIEELFDAFYPVKDLDQSRIVLMK